MLRILFAAFLLCLLGGAVTYSLRDGGDSPQPDPLIGEDLNALDSLYDATPFYALIHGRKWFVVQKGKQQDADSLFSGINHYGLADDTHNPVLPAVYDKIGNPDLTVAGCMEIFLKGKVGLVQYQTGKVLEPQFELLIPGAEPANEEARGLKAGQWYAVSVQDTGFRVTPVLYSAVASLERMRFDPLKIPAARLWIDHTYEPLSDELVMEFRRGHCITPSWLWKLGCAGEHCAWILLPYQHPENMETYYIACYQVQTRTIRRLSAQVWGFLVSFTKEGIGGRHDASNTAGLVTYCPGENRFETLPIGTTYAEPFRFRADSSYVFVNDSLVEARACYLDAIGSARQRYLSEPRYSYFHINRAGKIAPLVTNRYYAFTKFVAISESYFQGQYLQFMDKNNPYHKPINERLNNIWITSHLSTEDLDLMRNEIYADYGFRFKTTKWQEYFGKQPWYKPLHDDVSALLSPLDRHNLAVILRVRAKLAANEAAYLNKRKAAYYAAG